MSPFALTCTWNELAGDPWAVQIRIPDTSSGSHWSTCEVQVRPPPETPVTVPFADEMNSTYVWSVPPWIAGMVTDPPAPAVTVSSRETAVPGALQSASVTQEVRPSGQRFATQVVLQVVLHVSATTQLPATSPQVPALQEPTSEQVPAPEQLPRSLQVPELKQSAAVTQDVTPSAQRFKTQAESQVVSQESPTQLPATSPHDPALHEATSLHVPRPAQLPASEQVPVVKQSAAVTQDVTPSAQRPPTQAESQDVLHVSPTQLPATSPHDPALQAPGSEQLPAPEQLPVSVHVPELKQSAAITQDVTPSAQRPPTHPESQVVSQVSPTQLPATSPHDPALQEPTSEQVPAPEQVPRSLQAPELRQSAAITQDVTPSAHSPPTQAESQVVSQVSPTQLPATSPHDPALQVATSVHAPAPAQLPASEQVPVVRQSAAVTQDVTPSAQSPPAQAESQVVSQVSPTQLPATSPHDPALQEPTSAQVPAPEQLPASLQLPELRQSAAIAQAVTPSAQRPSTQAESHVVTQASPTQLPATSPHDPALQELTSEQLPAPEQLPRSLQVPEVKQSAAVTQDVTPSAQNPPTQAESQVVAHVSPTQLPATSPHDPALQVATSVHAPGPAQLPASEQVPVVRQSAAVPQDVTPSAHRPLTHAESHVVSQVSPTQLPATSPHDPALQEPTSAQVPAPEQLPASLQLPELRQSAAIAQAVTPSAQRPPTQAESHVVSQASPTQLPATSPHDPALQEPTSEQLPAPEQLPKSLQTPELRQSAAVTQDVTPSAHSPPTQAESQVVSQVSPTQLPATSPHDPALQVPTSEQVAAA